MVPCGRMEADDPDPPAFVELRAVAAPTRHLSASLIVARPSDGAPVVLPATAATVFLAATDWITVPAVDAVLARTFPAVPDEERRQTLDVLVRDLTAEGLVERR
jgi:hypothetical protein